MKENQVCSNKGPDLLQKGDNYKNVKLRWCDLKIFYRTTACANFYQILQKSSISRGDSSISNERDNPSPRGEYSKRVKIHRRF
jgi:hypothetical protein